MSADESQAAPAQTLGDIRLWPWLLLVLAIWALIYLPGLGAYDLKGEEARRVLPATDMLAGGSWILPSLGGEPYYNKPPGINWLVALSFLATGRRDELAARLPSALAVLAVALAMLLLPGRWPGRRARVISALIWLTNLGMIEKGRLIEIEAVYISLTGLALLWWLFRWVNGQRGWATWLAPALLLSLGALVKGPLLGIVFYATVLCVLAYHRRLRELLWPRHLAAVGVILLLCLGWLWLARREADATRMATAISSQLGNRISPSAYSLRATLDSVGGSLADLLPYLPALLLLWWKRITGQVPPRERPLLRAGRLALVIAYVALNLLPGAMSRYVMPVLPLACLLLGWALSLHAGNLATDRAWRLAVLATALLASATAIAGAWTAGAGFGWGVAVLAGAVLALLLWQWQRLANPLALTAASAAVIALAVLHYSVLAMPTICRLCVRRATADAISRAVPQGQTLYAYRPGYNPVLFYVRAPVKYLLQSSQIGQEVQYLLITRLREGPEQDALTQRLRECGARLIFENEVEKLKRQRGQRATVADMYRFYRLNWQRP